MSIERIQPVVATAPVETQQMRALVEALGLKPGETIQARVAAMLGDGLARLTVAGQALEVKTPQPLPVGAVLTMTVERQGQAMRLLLADNPAAPRAAPAAPPAPLGGALPIAAPGLATPIPATNAVAAALVDLVARGLVTPGATTGPGDGAQVALAVRGSQEASRLAEANAAGRAAPATPREALAEAVRSAAGRQESLSPLFADLSAVANGGTPAAARVMPEAVARAMAQVLGFRLPAEAAAAPQTLAQAIARSGTCLEAQLAALPPGASVPADLKAALGQLRAALQDWSATLGGEPADIGAKAATHERPPLRGALPHGQLPAQPSLGPDASAAETVRVLTERTEAALARLTLLQAASLPDSREIGRPDVPVQTLVEVPLRIGAETAMLQFQIVRERDAETQGASAGAGRQDWTMRFSMEAEPLGPIHAAVRWRDGHVGIQLWAERDGIAAQLDAARNNLSEALEASAFTIDQLTIAAGRPAVPREATAPRPPRLDRLS
ncbi:MAG: flagellar hook-length control protein FliK [Phreatobacter sp.]|uniref:flagellar hook-length control protein FliK n=1 Tax=Phreatobacter sp. TaxID=1966341 RepID=UPI001A4FD2C2|nr:flagellar hook-length control protein FliK [Phreatobacter sp.]MBL8567659.1 flagellar hook-length control protein FliK [Phreatobacter sp.]